MSEHHSFKVAIIEDDQNWQGLAERALRKLDIPVVAVVDSYVRALNELIPQLATLAVTHVLLDGNLTPGIQTGMEGKALASAIRTSASEVKIIGFSGGSQNYVDIPMGKDPDLKDLLQTIFFPPQQDE